jgi:hypothetical protein
MARRTQFLTLVSMLRSETKRADNVAVGVDDLTRMKYLINESYETLYDEHDWPHLRKIFDKITLSAGQRYFDFPTTLNYERIEDVKVWYSGLPHDVDRGIDVLDFATYDSTATVPVRAEPALKWDVRDTSGIPQFEIWPIPSSNSQTIQFTGIRKIDRLVNDIDLCLLDDYLVVLNAAASVVTNDDERKVLLAKMRDRLLRVKQRTHGASPITTLNGSPTDPAAKSRATVRVR